MATTTFNKNFVLSLKDASRFIESLKSTTKPMLDKNFKSSIVSEKDIRKILKKSIGK